MSSLSPPAHALFAELCALNDIHDTPQVLRTAQRTLTKWKSRLRVQFEAGQLSGIATATAMAELHDDVLKALFAFTAVQIFPLTSNQEGEKSLISLCAVGGYGRGEMAPFSDLDLLFLTPSKKPSARAKNIVEYFLYILWDLGLKVGHAIRSPEHSIVLARSDETILSSLLDLRWLAGAKPPASQLVTLLRKERTRAKIRNYISTKLGARDVRHAREGNSRYVIEPNIKEGKGGLRDLHELYWISRFVYGKKNHAKTDVPIKPHGVIAYIRHDLLNAKDAKRFTNAAEFLWQVRHHLHYIAGRASESLSFDRQDALAKRMGYTQDSPEARVEDFMRTYFMTTKEVGALTRIACAKLESQSAILLPQGLDRFLPTSRRGLKEPGFVLDHGRLNFANPKSLKKNPVLILRLFQIAGARNFDIHPDGFSILLQNMGLIDEAFRSSTEAANIFIEILLDSKAPGAVLKTMNEAGVLGAYLPEFGTIVARTQFNMHHAYTVDDHTISLIRILHDIEAGNLEREHPLASGFLKDLARRHRKCLYLACLLHDVGKSEGDQCLDGARMARQATLRMGLSDSDSDTVAWLVRNHLEMSETAQRRDTTDPATIEGFARIVGSIARLQMLTALTIVDIKAVGPGIWNDWKGALMRQLYAGARQCLLDGMYDPDRAVSRSDMSTLMGILTGETQAVVAPLFKTLPPSYWANTPQKVQVEHAGFFKDAQTAFAVDKNAKHFVRAQLNKSQDITELWIVSDDRKLLFADIVGAIAMSGASITGAHLHTAKNGFVFNIFYLQNRQGLAFGRAMLSRLKKLEQTTLNALKGKMGKPSLPLAPSSKRAEAIPVHPRAAFMRSAPGAAIIEVSGRDRPGLLYDLGCVLDKHQLSIRSAHVEVLGPKAIDVFYVSYEKNIAIDEEQLHKELMHVLLGQKVRS